MRQEFTEERFGNLRRLLPFVTILTVLMLAAADVVIRCRKDAAQFCVPRPCACWCPPSSASTVGPTLLEHRLALGTRYYPSVVRASGSTYAECRPPSRDRRGKEAFRSLDRRDEGAVAQWRRSEHNRRVKQALKSQKGSPCLCKEARLDRKGAKPRQRKQQQTGLPWVIPSDSSSARIDPGLLRPVDTVGHQARDEVVNARIASAVIREATCGKKFTLYECG